MTTTASGVIAKWASGVSASDLKADEIHFARRTLLDTAAVAIAGSRESASRIALQYALSVQTGGASTIWSDGMKTSTEMAALVNGTMSHVLDFDDVSSPQRGHPSVVLWPAIAALAQAEASDEIEAMTAYVIGLEIIAKLGRLTATPHVAKGWHSTPTLGVIGASVACGWLLKLSSDEITHAIGMALAHAAGTRENFGTMSKSLQAGIAASAAVRAAGLARLGFDAGAGALDGPAGFSALYGSGETYEQLVSELGKPFEATRSAVEIKKYPMCYATHRTVAGVLALKEQHGLTLDNIASVDIVASNKASLALIHAQPKSSLEAKFSMQYAVVTTLHDGVINLSSFDEDRVMRPEIQSFLKRVSSSEHDGPVLPRLADISIKLQDGRTLSLRVEGLKGSPEDPLSDVELGEKVADCCAFAASQIAADALSGHILQPKSGPFSCDFPRKH